MTRLFIRFYLGVLAILVIAQLVQAYVETLQDQSEIVQVVENALGGGVRLAAARIRAADSDSREEVLDSIRQNFAYPVVIVPADEIQVSSETRRRLESPNESVFLGAHMAIMLDEHELLIMGPLPQFPEPSQTGRVLGIVAVLLIAAAAIGLLLRPVVRQLHVLERAATAIAEGDLSARVNPQDVKAAPALVEAFNSMATQTQRMLQSQRDLLQAVSHELRTPLARIHFATDLIESSTSDEERNERLSAIEDAANELDALVDELLRYVRLDTAEPQLAMEELEVQANVDELVGKTASVAPSITFEIGDRVESSVTLHADRTSFHRAIGNVLSNAGRFARSGAKIRVAASDDSIHIEVHDDGAGIPAEDRQRVFEPFVRLDGEKPGAGLGLALVRRIVDAHGGSVSIDDSPLGGCLVSIEWPRQPTKN